MVGSEKGEATILPTHRPSGVHHDRTDKSYHNLRRDLENEPKDGRLVFLDLFDPRRG